MNNLHRELAPVSDAAWAEIAEEAARTFKRHVAGRRVVDVQGPAGEGLSAVGTGHIREIEPPGDGVLARQRHVLSVVELRVPFSLDREQIDDVARGSRDSDWQPVKDAARQLAFAEDHAVFDGYAAADIDGIRPGSSNASIALPAIATGYPEALAQALSELRSAGVNGPYSVVLSADAYTAASETSDHGYPVIEHLRRMITDDIVWAPAIVGGLVLTTRGGDFELQLGQDASIGYLSHTDTSVRLYLQESLTFLLLTAEAAVPLTPSAV
jgi:uncharacterized linocin/CFP29 family protein